MLQIESLRKNKKVQDKAKRFFTLKYCYIEPYVDSLLLLGFLLVVFKQLSVWEMLYLTSYPQFVYLEI